MSDAAMVARNGIRLPPVSATMTSRSEFAIGTGAAGVRRCRHFRRGPALRRLFGQERLSLGRRLAQRVEPWREITHARRPGSQEWQPRWTPDGKAITYVRREQQVDNLWLQPLNGGPARQLTEFSSDQIYKFAWSPDGRNLAVARGRRGYDLVLITGGGRK